MPLTALLVAAVCGWIVSTTPAAGVEHGHVCRYCSSGSFHAAATNVAPSAVKERTRHYAPDRHVDILHIKLDVTPDFDRRSVAGTATLRFTPIAEPLASLELDGVNLNVRAVRSSHTVRDWSAGREELTIVFDRPVPTDEEAFVEIDYSAEPLAGLYFCTPEMGFPPGDIHCWTQGEPHEARHWFPCFDHPNERSSTELVCHVPADMTVVSNGRLLSETVSRDGKRKTVHWLQEKPHVSYLICFVAGRLEKLEDGRGRVPLGFYTQPSRAQHAASGLRDTADIMTFFEAEIGVDFPWDKYDQCTIADFMWGGMENTTITTLAQRTLFEDPSDTVRASSTRRLNAHELAHQWFGNYVTCKDWSHLWLNEGFATYYTHLYEGHRSGRDALLYGLYLDAASGIFSTANNGDVRPIVYREYEKPSEQFDFRNYPKASWVLHMLRSRVGDDVFRQAVRIYLERHALSDVETEQLRRVFEELSGKPFERFFDQWLYHGGHPELTVEYRWLAKQRLAHVSVEQTQTTSADVLLFQFPTKLRFVVDGEVVDEPIEIKRRKHEFYFHMPAEPDRVRFDPEFTVLAKIEFKKSDALLLADLKNDADMIGRVLACEGLAKRPTAASVAGLRQALESDSFFGVRQSAATALRKIGTRAAVSALAESVEQDDARVRRVVIEELGKCYDDAARDTLQHIAVEEKLPSVAAAAIAALGRSSREDAAAAIRQALASRSFNNERVAAAFLAISESNDPAWAAELIDTLKDREGDLDGRSLSQGFFTLAQISQRGRRRPAAYDFLANYLDHPREPLRLGAIAALGELRDPRARMLLEPLTSDGQNQRVAGAAMRALATLDGKTEFVPDEVAQLRRELRDLRDGQEELKKTIEDLKARAKPAVGASDQAE